MAEPADPGNETGRRCPDCGADVGRDLRYCPACGRFVPGGRRRYARVAAVAGVGLWLVLVSLVILGYVWMPIVGATAEAVVWVYAILKGDWDVDSRRIVIATGIGLALLAIAAVVMRICGVGA